MFLFFKLLKSVLIGSYEEDDILGKMTDPTFSFLTFILVTIIKDIKENKANPKAP